MKQLSLISRALLAGLPIVALASALPVSADVVDLGVLEPEKVYEIPDFATVTATYHPSVSGPVRFVYTGNPLSLYSDTSHSEDSYVGGQHAYADGGQVMTYNNLDTSATYYLYEVAVMQGGTLVVHEGDTPLQVISTVPSTDPESDNYYGGKFSVSDNYRIQVNFNFPVTVGGAFVVVGDVRKPVSVTVDNTMAVCSVADALMALYRDGTMKEGDEMTFRLTQVADASDPENKYGEYGILNVPFTMAAKPAELAELVNANLSGEGNIFDSYYLSGDPAGMVTFKFDTPISTEIVPQANITYGDTDNIDLGIYTESVSGRVDGSEVVFDFTGTRRRPIDMLPNSTTAQQPEYLHVSFGNLYTADGQRAFTGMMSNPTGYSVSFKVNTIQYTVAADFSPARGSVLKAGQELEIWVMNGTHLQFDAVCFGYDENGEAKTIEIPTSEIRSEVDEFSEADMLYYVKVPEMNADAERGIEVSLKNVECGDGLDHSGDVYGDFKAENSGVAGIVNDSTSTFDVFDITGSRVLTGANASQLRSLAKGLYIVNGKKTIVK